MSTNPPFFAGAKNGSLTNYIIALIFTVKQHLRNGH